MNAQNIVVNLADVAAHDRNYNRHPPAQIKRIMLSLEKFGQVRSVVVWRGQFLAGHGVAQAARQLGWQTIRADVLPDDYPESLALGYIAADNELARQGDPDQAQLAAILEDVQKYDPELLEAIGFDDREFAALQAQLRRELANGDSDAEPQIDRAAEFNQTWRVKPGDLWRIGDHRLLCGDCTDKATVSRLLHGLTADLVLTDPPYNVGINYGSTSTDSKTAAQNAKFITAWFDRLSHVPCKVITPGIGYNADTLRQWLLLLPPRWLCIWLRRNAMSHSPLQGFTAWEPVLYYDNEQTDTQTEWGGVLVYGAPASPIGQDIFDIPVRVQPDVQDTSGNKYHPTPKPKELFEVLLHKFSALGAVVVDPFLGSGTTMVACENTGRRCVGTEISPDFCAVVLQRMKQAFPELAIERVGG